MTVTAGNLSACVAGEVIQLTPLVKRITAPNPSVLTGPGTNTYLVGNRDIAVVDPGPHDQSHLDGIMQAGNGNIRWIIVTHTHDDHSPAAVPLAKQTGAQLIGAMYPDDGYQDTSFQVASSVRDGERLVTAEFTLQALHTPGHVGNHFCFLLQEEAMLFTGDHIMEGSTVVIIPPGGDMADYIASLQRLLDYRLDYLAPGHGKLVAQPHDYIRYLISHRLKREQKVVEALQRSGQASLEVLVPLVYNDVDPSLHGIAMISLWAHLLKLQKEGRVVCERQMPVDKGAVVEQWVLQAS